MSTAHGTSGFAPSAKLRRRLFWALLAAVPLAAIALVVALLPERSSIGGAATVYEGPAQLADTHHYRLTAADRRQIDALLDAFIPAAVERRSAPRAWALAGPELRASSSLAAWRAGDSPVPRYLPRGTRFHDWTVVEVGRNEVLFNLLLQPRAGERLPASELAGQVIHRDGTWLVNRLYTIATFSPPPAAHTPTATPKRVAAGRASSPPAPRGRLSRVWLAPVLGVVVGGVLLVPLGLGLVAWSRARRFRRASAARSAGDQARNSSSI